jgi:hypothetical protein
MALRHENVWNEGNIGLNEVSEDENREIKQ